MKGQAIIGITRGRTTTRDRLNEEACLPLLSLLLLSLLLSHLLLSHLLPFNVTLVLFTTARM